MAEQFIRMLGKAVAIPGREPGKYQLDLWLANELILRQAGLLPAHIAVTDICTCHNSGYLPQGQRRQERESGRVPGIERLRKHSDFAYITFKKDMVTWKCGGISGKTE